MVGLEPDYCHHRTALSPNPKNIRAKMLFLYIFKIQKLHVNTKMEVKALRSENGKRILLCKGPYSQSLLWEIIFCETKLFDDKLHELYSLDSFIISQCYFQIKARSYGVTMTVFVLAITEPIRCFASCNVETFASVNEPLSFLFRNLPLLSTDLAEVEKCQVFFLKKNEDVSKS